MRIGIMVRCSVSVAALALASNPAWANEGASQPADDSAAEQADQAAQEPNAGAAEIVVSGYRQALESQQAIRRNSEQKDTTGRHWTSGRFLLICGLGVRFPPGSPTSPCVVARVVSLSRRVRFS